MGLEPILPYGKRILSPLRLPIPPFQVVSCQELASCLPVSQTGVLLHKLATGGGREGVRILDTRLFRPLLYYLSYPAIYLSVIH